MCRYVPIEKKVIRVNELIELLDISKPYAYQLIREPGFPLYELPTTGKRNVYRIPVKELNEWLAKQGTANKEA